ncbi:hypothetical protein SY85_21280 [Flavisolibacter tropicus]|uniref:Uncharacterized protein n=1 Tax=Flavisolibacter tropicus TaxID=1492898 RepID=A0A172U057_9BACT|nr:hypothetical protein SY85_21280 [Flavisolibacter tropicus]
MNRNSTSSMGALHPILFFALVYGISLFLAFYVCRTVYYTLNGDEPTVNKLTTSNSAATASVDY